jgi:phosphohistidine phosphatase SixA
MIRTRLIASLALAGALFAPIVAVAESNLVYVTRHAEKGTESKDPNLTPQGQARARTLALILRKAAIKQVYSTATLRTTQTAQPLATQAGVEVHIYDAGKPAIVIDKIKALPGPTLLVGHSNTVPDLVRMLGGVAAPMAEDEFDRLYQISINADGSVTTVLLTTPTAP